MTVRLQCAVPIATAEKFTVKLNHGWTYEVVRTIFRRNVIRQRCRN